VSAFPAGWRRLTAIWRRGTAHDVDAELAFHFAERTAELEAQGMSPEAARALASGEFGDVAATRSRLVVIDRRISRRRLRSEWFWWLRQDTGYVLRTLRRSPGFVVTVAMTLALGIGVNTAIFSVIDRLFLAPPPGIAHPDEVRRIFRFDPPKPASLVQPIRGDGMRSNFSYPEFARLRAVVPATTPLAGYDNGSATIGSGASSVSLGAAYVLGDYFTALGVVPAAGRFFTPEELRVETPRHLVVLSDAVWRRQFAANPSIVGTTITVDGNLHTIIGVTPPAFHGADNDAVDLWLPMNDEQMQGGRGTWYQGTNTFWILALALAPDRAAAERLGAAATVAFRHDPRMPDTLASARVRPIVPATSVQFNPRETAIATRLGAVAVIILLIGCANVAGLFMMRTAERRREIAVRLALGISRRRLAVLIFLEAVVIAALAGAAALLTAIWSGAALRHLLLPDTNFVDPAVSPRVIAFTVAAVLVAALIAAAVPIMQSGRIDLVGGLHGGTRGPVRSSGARRVLLTAQVALSTILLVAAAIFLRSFRSVETAPIGYDSSQLIFVTLRSDPAHPEQRAGITRRIPEVSRQIAALPGIERVALTANMPMYGMSFIDVRIPGRDTATIFSAAGPSVSWVSPAYFATAGMRLIAGRGLGPSDQPGAVVIDEAMAHHFWPNGSAVGQCVELDSPPAGCSTIVGVVTNTHAAHLVEPIEAEQIYLPLTDSAATSGPATSPGTIVVRAARGQTDQVVTMLQRRLAGIAGAGAIPDVRPMARNFANELRPWRTGAELFSATGFLALLVALVGIYSTVSYQVTQRTHEIGVRMALGAPRPSVVGAMLGRGIRDVFTGLAIGIALAFVLGRLVQAMVYRTSTRDPVVIVLTVSTLLVGALLASIVPAWRVIRVDPVAALRAD
jgi:predicted permease